MPLGPADGARGRIGRSGGGVVAVDIIGPRTQKGAPERALQRPAPPLVRRAPGQGVTTSLPFISVEWPGKLQKKL